MTTYLIIILIIAVAVAPLASALPSKAQRREAQLRAYASSLGLSIKLDPIPDIPARFRFSPSPNLVAYRLRDASSEDRVKDKLLLLRVDGQWIDTSTESAVTLPMDDGPSGMEIAIVNRGVATVFWNEIGGNADVDCLHRLLKDLLAFRR
jgi:hypothetical protein